MDHVKGYENVVENGKKLGAALPETMKAFREFTGTVFKDSVLSLKQKELIFIGIAIALRCEGCIESHTKNCIAARVSKEEFAEAVSVAIVMGGGPSTVYGGKAMEAFEQFSK